MNLETFWQTHQAKFLSLFCTLSHICIWCQKWGAGTVSGPPKPLRRSSDNHSNNIIKQFWQEVLPHNNLQLFQNGNCWAGMSLGGTAGQEMQYTPFELNSNLFLKEKRAESWRAHRLHQISSSNIFSYKNIEHNRVYTSFLFAPQKSYMHSSQFEWEIIPLQLKLIMLTCHAL